MGGHSQPGIDSENYVVTCARPSVFERKCGRSEESNPKIDNVVKIVLVDLISAHSAFIKSSDALNGKHIRCEI